MKLLSSHFVAPAILATLSLLAGCSSDNPPGGNTAGASPGGASGKAGAGGASAGAAGGLSTAGGGSGGTSTAGAGAGGGTSTAGAGGGDTVEASFNTVREMIRLQPCTGGGCHGEENVPMHWGPDDPALYTLVMNHMTLNCGKLINTASPADSALIKVLKGDCGTAPNITKRMPYGKCFEGDNAAEYESCVSPAKVAAILAWITKGAPQQ